MTARCEDERMERPSAPRLTPIEVEIAVARESAARDKSNSCGRHPPSPRGELPALTAALG